MSDSTRPLPDAAEPAASVLSCIMQDPELLDSARERGITADTWANPGHAIIFGLLEELGPDFDLITATKLLGDRGQLANIGGPGEITRLATFTPTAAHFARHCDFILASHTLRFLIGQCTSFIHSAYESPPDPTILLTDLISRLEAHIASRDAAVGADTQRIGDILPAVLQDIQERTEGKSTQWVPSPWPDIRIERHGATFVGARPGIGKSAFLENLATHMATAGEPTAIISLEMPRELLAGRALASQAHTAVANRNTFTRGELSALQKTVKALSAAPLYIAELPGATADQIVTEARRLQRRHGVATFCIDYIQDIGADGREEAYNDKLRIDNALRRLDVARKKSRQTHIFAAQLDRAAEDIPARQMSKRMLADTSLLEKIAYSIIMLGTRPDSDPFADLLEMEAHIVKNRNGSTGLVTMLFHKPTTTWTQQI